MHYLYYNRGFEGFGLLHAVFELAVFVGVMIVIVLIIRHFMQQDEPKNNGPSRAETADHALTILKERYAKGELDRAEYEERKEVLSK